MAQSQSKPVICEEIYWDMAGIIHIMSDKTVYEYKFPSLGTYSQIKSKHCKKVKVGSIVMYKLLPSIYNDIKPWLINKKERKLVK